MPHVLETAFRDFVEKEGLFSPTDPLLLACSGGLDSTVLAHLLHQTGYTFALTHMNFGLRGAASDGDAAFVADLARTLGARFFQQAVDVKHRARPGESTQMTARRLRYEWFYELLRAHDYRFLLTAHHADDSLETALINLIRGTGLPGLTGIRLDGPDMRRPLLGCARAELRAYAHARQLRWREDASNASDDYLRNRIRHHLTPQLQALGLTTAGWIKTSANLRDDQRIHDAGTSHLLNRYTHFAENVFTIQKKGWHRTHSLPAFLATLLPRRYGFTREHIRQMLLPNGSREVRTAGHLARVTGDTITIIPRTTTTEAPLPNVLIDRLPFCHEQTGRKIWLEWVPRPENLRAAEDLHLAPPTFPLHLRPRQNGDRFRPFGMGGKRKKIQDFFVDRKIPVWQRDNVYVLTDVLGEIIAIPGFTISEQLRIGPENEQVMRIRIED